MSTEFKKHHRNDIEVDQQQKERQVDESQPPLKKAKLLTSKIQAEVQTGDKDENNLTLADGNQQTLEKNANNSDTTMVTENQSAAAANGEAHGGGPGKKQSGEFDTNLYSRQLYTFGETAMRRLRCAEVLVSGMGGVGVEIAKNLVLSGVRHVTVHDTKPCTYMDLANQYYLNESSLNKNRASACHPSLVELNDSVSVELKTEPLTEDFVKKFDVIVLTDHSLDEQLKIDKWTHALGKKLIVADCFGLFGMIFNDFGQKHVIDDPDGNQCLEVYVEHIDKASGDVVCLEDTRHGFQDGDYVTFSEIKGMTELNNCPPRKIRVITPVKFNIGDLSKFSDHIEGGKAKQVKVPFEIAHKPLSAALEEPEFLVSDFAKMERPNQFHIFVQALHKFRQDNGRLPNSYDAADSDNVFAVASELNAKTVTKAKVEKLDKSLCDTFCHVARGQLCPLSGFIGGVAAQEAMKAVTGKYTPIKQFFYFDAYECLPDKDSPFSGIDANKCAPKNCRYDGQAAVFGWQFQEALFKENWFVVGAGAIGCELMKYFAMIGLGSGPGGRLTITDMDQIEISNLNRQFLFRRNNVGQKKSTVAAESAKRFNPDLNIVSICERVGGDTEQIFDDTFFSNLNGVANALDNVEARTYMDRRCVYYRKPLLETGTLGPSGNTQVVYPFLTESYSSSHDPPEKSIPICTVKHFPNQIEHTIQWARELFQGLFANPAETANQFIEDTRTFFDRVNKMHAGQKMDMLQTVKKVLIDERPTSVEQCVHWARRLFEESFNWDIRQLLHNFPPDQVTSHGIKFWSGTKRCPKPLTFDPNNAEQVEFVHAAAYLRAQMYNLTPPKDAAYVVTVANDAKLPKFTPRDGVRIAVNDQELQQTANQSGEDNDNIRLQELNLALAKLKLDKSQRLTPIDFEKDDDTNHHIDFINAASNLRAENYSIPKADKLQTKKIAGRIIPAIATTTAAVAGLDCLELYKIVMGAGNCKLETFKNGFLNLALPYFGFAEPIQAPKKKYYDTEWTLWDRIEVQGDLTLQEFFDHMKKVHKLEVSMLSQGVCILYSFFMPPQKKEDRKKMTISQLVETTSGQPIPKHVKALVLEPMCTDLAGNDVEVPYVNYVLPVPAAN